LTRVVFLCFFCNWFYSFRYILQYKINQELDFIIYFNLLSIGLYWSHDSGHEFDKLTRVESSLFFVLFNWFCFQFHPSTLSLLKIELYNLFWYAFYRVITFSWLDVTSQIHASYKNVFVICFDLFSLFLLYLDYLGVK